MNNIYYVYAYINKKTLLPYYIGKGKHGRAFEKHGWVGTPKDKTKIVFLETNLTELGAFALERRYILWYGRKDKQNGILLNRTDGGEGGSGVVVSEETKKKRSINQTGKIASDTTKKKMSLIRVGMKFTESHKRKISEASKGENNAMFGKIGELSPNYGKISITNGIINTRIFPDEIIPEGWYTGISEQMRYNLSSANSGENNPFYNKVHTKETRKYLSILNTGKPSGNKGKRYKWITDGQFNKFVPLNFPIAEGWYRGKTKEA